MTKLIHNSLQGDKVELTEEHEVFFAYNAMNARGLRGRLGRGGDPRPQPLLDRGATRRIDEVDLALPTSTCRSPILRRRAFFR